MKLRSARILVLFFTVIIPLVGGDHWRWSVGAVAASSVADITSSYGFGELNPLLRNGKGEFGVRGVIIKGAVIGGYLGVQYLILRKRPWLRKDFTLTNWGIAGVWGSVAVYNFKVRKRHKDAECNE